MSENTHADLFGEEPVSFIFRPSIARALGGQNEAAFIERLHYFVKSDKGGERVDGRHWVWNTYEGWAKLLRIMNANGMRKMIQRLERLGVLLSRSDLNKAGFDKTKWYTIDYERLRELTASSAQSVDPCAPQGQTMRPPGADGSAPQGQTNTREDPEESSEKNFTLSPPPAAEGETSSLSTLPSARETNKNGSSPKEQPDSVARFRAEWDAAAEDGTIHPLSTRRRAYLAGIAKNGDAPPIPTETLVDVILPFVRAIKRSFPDAGTLNLPSFLPERGHYDNAPADGSMYWEGGSDGDGLARLAELALVWAEVLPAEIRSIGVRHLLADAPFYCDNPQRIFGMSPATLMRLAGERGPAPERVRVQPKGRVKDLP